jgi:hypothetical protein
MMALGKCRVSCLRVRSYPGLEERVGAGNKFRGPGLRERNRLRKIAVLKDRLSTLDRERSEIANRLGVLEHAQIVVRTGDGIMPFREPSRSGPAA